MVRLCAALILVGVVCCATVPDVMINLWKRIQLESPKGKIVDTTTRVFNLQTDSFYADIRIPMARDKYPLLHKASIKDYTDEELLVLAQQKTFAGFTQVDSKNISLWNREIDYQPPTPNKDIGTIDFTSRPGFLIEEGIGDDDYREIWQPMAKDSRLMSLTLINETSNGKLNVLTKGIFVLNGQSFIQSINRRAFVLPEADSLVELFEKQKLTRPQREDILSKFVSCYGNLGTWTVELSTFPYFQNKTLGSTFSLSNGILFEQNGAWNRYWKVESANFNPFETDLQ
jgi:hypothetical protein